MVDWAQDYIPKDPPPAIIEVGTGNGTLLFALQEAGYDASHILGVDYSEDAVRLARAIGESRGDEAGTITFQECDFLQTYPSALPTIQTAEQDIAIWDLVLDKGTFDAIALAEKDNSGKAPAADYPPRIGAIVKPGGYFLITCACNTHSRAVTRAELFRYIACNFTEEELITKFANSATGLKYQYVRHISIVVNIRLTACPAQKWTGQSSPSEANKAMCIQQSPSKSRHSFPTRCCTLIKESNCNIECRQQRCSYRSYDINPRTKRLNSDLRRPLDKARTSILFFPLSECLTEEINQPERECFHPRSFDEHLFQRPSVPCAREVFGV